MKQGNPSSAVTVGAGDRLGATMTFSVLAHAVIALGVGFSVERPAAIRHTLDVILTQTRSQTTPEKPDFLAQHSQQGGGDNPTPERPAEPQRSLIPKPDAGLAPAPVAPGSPRPQTLQQTAVVTTQSTGTAQATAQDRTPTDSKPLPSSRELIEHSLEMAKLAAEIDRQSIAYAKRPKRKFVSASTQEFEYASYMRAWVARVERIGNLNYPDEARRRNLHGQLVMTVAMRRDGSIERIDIVQPSGYPVLDDAAQRIVRLGEPYAPLPEKRDGTDILHITRTWQFLPGNVLRNK